ncbi:MAG: signal peptidase I [Eubacteriales bacterium]
MRRIKEYWIEFLPPVPAEPPAQKRWVLFYEWIDSVMGAIIVIFFLFTFLFRAVGVDGTSMVPTLNDKDWVAISGINFVPKRGDIVVVTQPNDVHEPLIKRIIAIGGDTIDINFITHVVKINSVVIDEPYIAEPTQRSFDVTFPVTVPKGFVFVMGDNRNNSKDSRASGIGMIDERYILGKAGFRFYPFNSFNIYNYKK